MIIGAAAQLNSGKDVLCDYLFKRLNANNSLSWKRSAFANAVKDVYQRSFGVDRDFIEAWKRDSNPPPGMLMNVRKGLQFIGDGFRQIKSDIWIDIVFRDSEKENIIISDCRYINEAKAIKNKGGMTVLMHRVGFLNDDPNPSESQIKPIVQFCLNNLKDGPIPNLGSLASSNPPEGIEFYDFFLNNDGTLEDLYSKIDNLLVPFVHGRLN
jgi:hypothetical protein